MAVENIFRILKSIVAGKRPTANPDHVGMPFVNFADKQFGAMDTAGNPIDLLAVRHYSATAGYVADDLVAKDGVIYKAKNAVSPGGWNIAHWSHVTTLKLGETAATAYRGDHGKANRDDIDTMSVTEHDAAKTYAVNDLVSKAGTIYRCYVAVPTAAAFSATNWESISPLETLIHDEIEISLTGAGPYTITSEEAKYSIWRFTGNPVHGSRITVPNSLTIKVVIKNETGIVLALNSGSSSLILEAAPGRPGCVMVFCDGKGAAAAITELNSRVINSVGGYATSGFSVLLHRGSKDLNTYIYNGRWYVNSAFMVNGPANGSSLDSLNSEASFLDVRGFADTASGAGVANATCIQIITAIISKRKFKRTLSRAGWSVWKPMWEHEGSDGLNTEAAHVYEGSKYKDLNNMKTSGTFYLLSQAIINMPPGGAYQGPCFITVVLFGTRDARGVMDTAKARVLQTVTNMTQNKIWIRGLANNTWSAWTEH